jgi:hypothetical protein
MQKKQVFAQMSRQDIKHVVREILKTAPVLIAVSVVVGAPLVSALVTASVGGLLMVLGSYIFGHYATHKVSINLPLLAIIALSIATFSYAQSLTVFALAAIMMVSLGLTPLAYWLSKRISPVILVAVLAALSLTAIVNQIPIWLGIGISTGPIWTTIATIVTSLHSIDVLSLMLGMACLFMLGLYQVLRKQSNPTDAIHNVPILLVLLIVASIVTIFWGKTETRILWTTFSWDIDMLLVPKVWNYAAIIAIVSIRQLWADHYYDTKTSHAVAMATVIPLCTVCMGAWPAMSNIESEYASDKKNRKAVYNISLIYIFLGLLALLFLYVAVPISMTGAAIVTIAALSKYTSISLYEDMWDRGKQTFVVFAVAFAIALYTPWVLIAVIVAKIVDFLWLYTEQSLTKPIKNRQYDCIPQSNTIQHQFNNVQQHTIKQQTKTDVYDQVAKHAHISPKLRPLQTTMFLYKGTAQEDLCPLESIDQIVNDFPIIPVTKKDGTEWKYVPIYAKNSLV